MKPRFCIISFVAAVIFFSQLACAISWSEDTRLTFNAQYSSQPEITAGNGKVHIVWHDFRDGSPALYYKASYDNGTMWNPDNKLVYSLDRAMYPGIASDGDTVHLVWQDSRNENFEIYYKNSDDGGVTWSDDRRLTSAMGWSYDPSIGVDGDDVHVVWQDNRNGNSELFYKRSTNAGLTWTNDQKLMRIEGTNWHYVIAASGRYLHLLLLEDLVTYYLRSEDKGTLWSETDVLVESPSNSWHPSVAVDSSTVHVVWADDRDGNFNIYYKSSDDNGETWNSDVKLTDSRAYSNEPVIAARGNDIYVLWQDYRDGNLELYYKESHDGGKRWSTDVRLTKSPDNSVHPSITLDGEYLHVVWQDFRLGNDEIYYKRGRITGDDTTEISIPLNETPVNAGVVSGEETNGDGDGGFPWFTYFIRATVLLIALVIVLEVVVTSKYVWHSRCASCGKRMFLKGKESAIVRFDLGKKEHHTYVCKECQSKIKTKLYRERNQILGSIEPKKSIKSRIPKRAKNSLKHAHIRRKKK